MDEKRCYICGIILVQNKIQYVHNKCWRSVKLSISTNGIYTFCALSAKWKVERRRIERRIKKTLCACALYIYI